MSLNDESRYGKDPYRRPNTAGGKRIHAISPNGNEKLDEKGLQNGLITQQPVDRHGTYREKGYFEHQPQAQRHFEQCQGIAQVRPVAQEVGRYAARIDQLEAPIANGRDWEDNRTRPSTPHDIRIRLGYERSKTMPTALSEIVPKPGQQRKYPEELRWQEPGPTAGYYGPEDRGYTPTSPANLSKQRLAAQSQKQSDEKRLGEKIAKFDAPNLKPHQQHDSLGEFFDNYYDASQQEYQPQFEKTECQLRGFAEGDLPNFDGVPDAERRTYRTDPYANGQPPRSKSQPSSQDRPPRQRHENEFDFGILCGPSRPPATAPARTGFGPSTIRRMNAPNNSPQLGDQHLRGRNYQGRMPASNYRFNHNPANFPLPRARQPAPANQGKAPPDQYTSPPDGFSREGQMKPLNDRLSPTNRIGPTPSPIGLPSNPDALPPHATPVPPGLKERSPVNQPIKPPPIRQYNTATIPLQLSGQSGNPKDSSYPASMKKVAVPVTHQELERLRQATTRKPDDHVTQLALAKKLVEAASVLVDERADSKTRNKNREKYILDGHRIVKKLSNIGYADASFYLADCYSRGALGLEANSREAFKLYQSAAKAGHAQAAYRVAVCCEIGQEEDGGTRRDAGKAMQWYERAATLGDTSAMYKMGIIFLKGLLGQPKNPREAIVLLKRAVERADEDNPHALHELVSLPIRTEWTRSVDTDITWS